MKGSKSSAPKVMSLVIYLWYQKISLIYIMSITRDIIFNRISQHADMDGNWTYRHRLPLIASNFGTIASDYNRP